MYGHCLVPALCRRCYLRVRERETRDGRERWRGREREELRLERVCRFDLCGSLKDGLLSSTMRYSKEDARKEKLKIEK